MKPGTHAPLKLMTPLSLIKKSADRSGMCKSFQFNYFMSQPQPSSEEL